MPTSHKVLLLDDDQDLLEIYKDLLSRLPSKPDIHTASSGARAIALLESEPFTLLLSDLNMPKMDGLQVLTIVRRKFPQLRTAVMTSVVDEQFRARAYDMGVDLYLEKPNTSQEIQFFLDCVESLIDKEAQGGFRGVQSKSLIDIIQLECLSQSSSVLKFSNGGLVGKVWIINGEIIDSEFQDQTGESAFQRILAWKTGNFETFPAEPGRTRTIFNSYQGLLLEASQIIDEAQSNKETPTEPPPGETPAKVSPLAEVGRIKGVEFVVAVPENEKSALVSYGIENAEKIATWARTTCGGLQELGDKLKAGEISQVECLGFQAHIFILQRNRKQLCVGFNRSMSNDIVRESLQQVISKWVS